MIRNEHATGDEEIMLFKKLPIVFLSTVISEEGTSTNGHIATYILEHLEQVKSMNIHELAESCHVAKSSISRFCRYTGLEDFSDLKEVLNTVQLDYRLCSHATAPQQRVADLLSHIADSFDRVQNSVDYRKIHRLCLDIKSCHKVSVFGLLKAETAAINLQSDLLMLGKVVHTQIQFKRQQEYLKQAGEDELIIIFSYTGVYFDYYHEQLKKQLHKPKLYFITSSKALSQNEAINELITFDSRQDQASHPYQLQCVASIIAQEYAYQMTNEKPECN